MNKENKLCLETFRELNRLTGQSVTLSHEQVLEVTVKELLSKYEAHKKSEIGESFCNVLRFYLSPDEFDQAMSLERDIRDTRVINNRDS